MAIYQKIQTTNDAIISEWLNFCQNFSEPRLGGMSAEATPRKVRRMWRAWLDH